ncbi:MAG: molybdopterin-dependent oxidoreductase [Candidatus Promineifilaceae bacterium]|nr:molybdopterin-dependent oxidoreductase [Candidatus Promineifilaceae bacterium]
MPNSSDDPLAPHAHEPNPDPPSSDASFMVQLSDGRCLGCSPELLKSLPRSVSANVFIVSTGHGTSGPFRFEGVTLADFMAFLGLGEAFSKLEIVSEDGFGTRVTKGELEKNDPLSPILLADRIDNRPLSRRAGLLRLIVPSERDDALRQVKWVYRIRLLI